MGAVSNPGHMETYKMRKTRRKVEIRVDGYTRCCLGVIAVLLTVLIAALWAQPITPSIESKATAAPLMNGGVGIPDSGKQREEMIKELQSTNAKLDKLIRLLETGKAKVQVCEDAKAAGKTAPKPAAK